MSRSVAALAYAGLLALVACGAEQTSTDSQVKLKMYTWWTKDGEKQALDSLERNNKVRHPNVSLSRNAAQSADAAFSQLDAVLAYKSPPDTFQVNGGSPLLSRVVFERAGIEQTTVVPSRLRPLESVYTNTKAEIWPFLHPLITVRGVRYGVPLNLHRINNLYFSIPKLLRARNLAQFEHLSDLRLPQDIDGFMAFVRELERINGGPPLGIGIRDRFTIETLVFENLLPSVAITATDLGPAGQATSTADKLGFFERFWKGEGAPRAAFDHAVVDGALRRAQELWHHVVSIDSQVDGDNRGAWSDPFDDLMREDSPVCLVVMGDWATGYLEKNGAEYMRDFAFVPFPGTEQLFIYTTDTLPLTVGADHVAETLDFLETALDFDAQLDFNEFKGSVPALVLDESQIVELKRPFQQEALRQILNPDVRKSVAFSGLVTPDVTTSEFRAPLESMLTGPDPDNGRENVHHAIENYYWLLTLWTNTIGGVP